MVFVYHFRAKDNTVQEGTTDNFEKKDVKTYKSKRDRMILMTSEEEERQIKKFTDEYSDIDNSLLVFSD